jgi:hypothetical protein
MVSIGSKKFLATRTKIALLLAISPISAAGIHAQQKTPAACKVVVVGYVGGLDVPGNPISGIIQIRNRLQNLNHPDLCVATFSAYTWLNGYRWLMKRIAFDKEKESSGGPMTQDAKVIVYGHSLGGWATLALSRRLAKRNIPVELTVQVDSVGFTDATVPPNVKEAANYFRRATLPPYGRAKIYAEDAGKTQILGNFEIDHADHIAVAKAPVISDLIVESVQALYPAPE